MTNTSLKRFRVLFTDTRHMCIELEARSAEDAIAKAEHLYIEGDRADRRFRKFSGDSFSCPEAEEVSP